MAIIVVDNRHKLSRPGMQIYRPAGKLVKTRPGSGEIWMKIRGKTSDSIHEPLNNENTIELIYRSRDESAACSCDDDDDRGLQKK